MAVAFVIKTYADALFLAEYGVAYVPHFMVGQAIALVAAAYGYGRLIRAGRTLLFDATILTTLMILATLAPLLADRGRPWPFIVSLSLIATSAMTQMVIWNAATAVVSGRAARTFLPRAGAAATAGAVVGGFVSSAIVGVSSLQTLAPVAAALTLVTLSLRFSLRTSVSARRLSAQIPATRGTDTEGKSVKRLVVLLASATVVEALLSAVVDYGFKREVELTFNADPEGIGLFLALFYGTSNVVLLGIQMFAASRLLATRSLKFSLGVQPITQGVATLIWAAVPLLPLAAICRGLENVFKFGIARPAQEVALTPLRDIQRKRWKVLLRGVYAQGGALGAGLLLMATAPVLALHPSLVPLLGVVLALVWLSFQRRTANAYRHTLGSALGLRRRLEAEGEERLVVDRDSLEHVVELAGRADGNTARLANQLIEDLVANPARLIPHLKKANTETRAAIYRVLATRPDRSTSEALHRAVSAESDTSKALADGLVAAGMHQARALTKRAKAVSKGTAPDTAIEPAASAWFYLAAVKAISASEIDTVFATSLGRYGRRGAMLASALEDSKALGRDEIVERVVASIDQASSIEEMREGLYVASRLGHPALLGRLLRALAAGTPGAATALAQLPVEGLAKIAEMMTDLQASSRTRARFVRALRALDATDVSQVVSPYLFDESAEVRDVAAHTLLSQVRRGHSRPSSRTVRDALERQLDRFELYVAARPGTRKHHRESAMSLQLRHFARGNITQEAFFLDELDRRTERSLGRVADLLALAGEDTTVYAAERALKSTTFKRRRQAIDLLQETVRGRQRARLLDLLEQYLMPSGTDDEARERVCELDPWLARCQTTQGDKARTLWALRRAPLFDAVPGEAIERLLQHCELCTFEEGATIVSEGEAGDALYVVMDGAVSVIKDGQTVAQLTAGEAFGELALLDGHPRGATVRALERTDALRLPVAPFRRAQENYPELGFGLMRGLVQMLRTKLG